MNPKVHTDVSRVAEAAARTRDLALRGASAAARRGIVHTPAELARFVVRSVEDVLRRRLAIPAGFGDPKLSLVDPACGPGVFLAALAEYLPEMPREIVGIDVDPAVIPVANAVLEPLRRAGLPVVVRQANALHSVEVFGHTPEWAVVFGNPPWSSRAASRGEAAIESLLEDFRCDGHGIRLRERKLGVLSDAYVHFVRWSAEVVRSATKGGVFALLTNGSYLDGSAHRGMRSALLRWFDGIEVVDLGGNAMVSRGLGRDENVFGVRPSVALTVAWRSVERRHPSSFHYVRIRGGRSEKLDYLHVAHVASMDWQSVVPKRPLFLFKPDSGSGPLPHAVSLADVMPFNREGVQTNRDRIVTDVDPDRLRERLAAFAEGKTRSDFLRLCQRQPHYNPDMARAVVKKALLQPGFSFSRLAYRAGRPPEIRWFFSQAPVCHRPRPSLQQAMEKSQWALLTVGKDRGEGSWHHVGLTRYLVDSSYLSNRSSCRTRAFPTHAPNGTPNFSSDALAPFAAILGDVPDFDAFVAVAFAVMMTPVYGESMQGTRRLDYPRLPVPTSRESFQFVRRGGEQLISLAQTIEQEPGTAEAILEQESLVLKRLGPPVAQWLRNLHGRADE